MENVLKKIYFFFINFIPDKKLRHKLREKFNRYFYLDIIPAVAVEKVCAFKGRNFETVALGSSHCESSFNPKYIESPSFNFGLSSSDSFIIQEIYYNFIKNSDIKNVIVFYDVFTRGSDVRKARNFKYQFLPLKYIVSAGYGSEDKRIEYLCKKALKNCKPTADYEGFRDFKLPTVLKENYDTHYKSHLKLWNLKSRNEGIIDVARDCIENHKNFILVLSPATKLYKSYFPSPDILFKDIISELQALSGFSDFGKIYDFYDTDIFEDDSLWADADHANLQGAEKFSKALNKKLKEDNIIE